MTKMALFRKSPTETLSYRAGLLDSIYSTNGIQIAIGRDHLNRLVRFGAIQLKWNQRGLVQIGAETFEWDHNARPIKMNGQIVFYDEKNRIRQIGNGKYIIYTNQNEKNRVTHYVNGNTIQEYFYDLNGALFAILQRKDQIQSYIT